MIRTRLTERLGLDFPIVSAPMSGHSGGNLAGAVSAAGGLGTFGAVFSDEALGYLEQNITRAREVTNRAFGVGFITPYLDNHAAQMDAVLEAGVPVITLSFSDPRPWLGRIKAAGRTAICQVHTFEMAEMAVAGGADVLAIQGNEAGGHSGEQGLMPALCKALDAFPDTPIIAAGGIADGRGLAAVLAAGADGAWIGTGFRAVSESLEIDDAERAAILANDGRSTVRSRVTDIVSAKARGGREWPSGIGNRTTVNKLVAQWHGHEDALETAIAEDPAPFAEDPTDKPYLFSDAAGFVQKQETAKEFMERICAEAAAHLKAAAARAG